MGVYDYVMAVVSLLGGLGAFLISFKILSESIEKLANSGLKKLFKKTSKNRFIGVGIGAVVTMIIQSSSATTVMIVGFVNAGVMDLFQATAMIMGANIGTTITAQIVALNSLEISGFLVLFSFVGIFGNMLAKREKTKTIFMALAGLGLVFISLELMSSSMEIFKNSESFQNVLTSIYNPFLLLLIGMGITAVLQSSSAVTTIIISMVAAGITIGNGGNSVLYVILGTNIGTCITALLSSIGASPNARRASLIHLMFNVFGAIIFFVILLCWPQFMDMTFGKWFALPATQIAMFHTFFNVIATILFLPIINVFVKLSKIIISDRKSNDVVSYLDDRFLHTPSIAIDQASKETVKVGILSMEALNESIQCFIDKKENNIEQVREKISMVYRINDSILDYLLKITSQDVTESDEAFITKLHHILIDFTRSADIADNMLKYTLKEINENLEFSSAVNESILNLKQMLNEQFNNVQQLFIKRDQYVLSLCEKLEENIDSYRKSIINEHIKRLEDGKCSPRSNMVFINLISNLERCGDHLYFAAKSLMEN